MRTHFGSRSTSGSVSKGLVPNPFRRIAFDQLEGRNLLAGAGLGFEPLPTVPAIEEAGASAIMSEETDFASAPSTVAVAVDGLGLDGGGGGMNFSESSGLAPMLFNFNWFSDGNLYTFTGNV